MNNKEKNNGRKKRTKGEEKGKHRETYPIKQRQGRNMNKKGGENH